MLTKNNSEEPAEMRCVGRFVIPFVVIEACPQDVKLVMSKMSVVRASESYDRMVVEYTGISKDLFKPIPEGEVVPEYNIVVSDGEVTAEQVEALTNN